MGKWKADLDAWERMQAVKNATKNGKVDHDGLKSAIKEINKKKEKALNESNKGGV